MLSVFDLFQMSLMKLFRFADLFKLPSSLAVATRIIADVTALFIGIIIGISMHT